MNNSNKAVFLDRDGVINDLVFYPEEGMIDSPNSPKQFKLINGVGEALTIKEDEIFVDINFKPTRNCKRQVQSW